MRRYAWVALVVAGCAETAPAPVELALDDATVAQAAAAVAGAGVSIAVAPDASLLAGCARVTLHTAGAVPRGDAARLLARALESSALTMREAPEGWVIDLASGGRVPSSCTDYLLTRLLGELGGGGPTVSAPTDPIGSAIGALADLPVDPAPPPIEPAAPPSDPAATPVDQAAIVAGIRAVSETEIVLTPAARDALFEHMAELTSTVRIIPQAEGGRMIGMRLFGIRAGSAVAALGLQNGDVILTVAGHDVSSPDSALAAYAEMVRTAGPIPVELRRRGGTLTIRYRVEDPPR